MVKLAALQYESGKHPREEKMAPRFSGSCSPLSFFPAFRRSAGLRRLGLKALAQGKLLNATCAFSSALWLLPNPASSQMLLKPSQPGEAVHLLPSDLAILEAGEIRKDIPCTVTDRKAELGFDLRFHGGYDVTIPLNELAGNGEVLTVVFRVYPRGTPGRASYFVQHFTVPPIGDEAKGDATLQGSVNLGEGGYHVDWLMRDRGEHLCSSAWDLDAELPAKDKPIPLFITAEQVTESIPQPFINDVVRDQAQRAEDNLTVKLLVNFAPQEANSAALQRSDTEALVSILKTIQRDPRVGHLSLVAFNIDEGRVVYRQEMAADIDYPALGKALQTMKLGTINLQRLEQKHSETAFLENLIATEVGTSSHPDAVIFAGPKAMLSADVPQESLRRIGDIDCPVFYMNYTLNPQAVPWKDSISHAIRTFKGTEYTISRPRDLWFSTSEMVGRIVRRKREKALGAAVGGGAH
jgi:hypothetical protein